jgi:hypothetical protein
MFIIRRNNEWLKEILMIEEGKEDYGNIVVMDGLLWIICIHLKTHKNLINGIVLLTSLRVYQKQK